VLLLLVSASSILVWTWRYRYKLIENQRNVVRMRRDGVFVMAVRRIGFVSMRAEGVEGLVSRLGVLLNSLDM